MTLSRDHRKTIQEAKEVIRGQQKLINLILFSNAPSTQFDRFNTAMNGVLRELNTLLNEADDND